MNYRRFSEGGGRSHFQTIFFYDFGGGQEKAIRGISKNPSNLVQDGFPLIKELGCAVKLWSIE